MKQVAKVSFGQERVLQMLRDMGGKATKKEMVNYIRTRYPGDSFADQIGMRLWKAKAWGEVDFKGGVWSIRDKEEY